MEYNQTYIFWGDRTVCFVIILIVHQHVPTEKKHSHEHQNKVLLSAE